MVAYKLRHIETGLFYQPLRGHVNGANSNLSKAGKIYESKIIPIPPAFMKITTSQAKSLCLKVVERKVKRSRYDYIAAVRGDFEIVVIFVAEVEILKF